MGALNIFWQYCSFVRDFLLMTTFTKLFKKFNMPINLLPLIKKIRNICVLFIPKGKCKSIVFKI